jgi:hypothetical protein
MIGIRILLAAILFLQSGSSAQPPLQWSWFDASSVANNWSINRGRADVTIAKGVFKATLWDGDSQNFSRLNLSGTFKGNDVRVKVTVNSSDEEPYRATGKLTRSCWEGGGREAIVLTSGFGVIGLVREIIGGRCTPIH